MLSFRTGELPTNFSEDPVYRRPLCLCPFGQVCGPRLRLVFYDSEGPPRRGMLCGEAGAIM